MAAIGCIGAIINDDIDKSPNVLYEGQVFQIRETMEFGKWFDALRDRKASAKIADRIRRAGDGNFGDVKREGGGVSALRVDYGPGYRSTSASGEASWSYCFAGVTNAHRIAISSTPNSLNRI
jgi:putative component of toxin-antitoxin plasmid stabilization module